MSNPCIALGISPVAVGLRISCHLCHDLRVQLLQDPEVLNNFQHKLEEEYQKIPAVDTAEEEWSQLAYV